MSGRSVQHTRSNAWQSSVAASSAVVAWVSTNDPSASVVSAPIPTLTIHFGGKPGASFGPTRPAPPARPSAAALPPVSPAAPEPQPEPEPAFARPEPRETEPPNPHRIELIIDSLPHHELAEPIPVTIDPLGDAVFTASVRDLDISATGNSFGESLLLLKEQIEFVYDELNRRLAQLDHDQRTTLQMLHTYIAPQAKKLEET
jgi:hypothetical protein